MEEKIKEETAEKERKEAIEPEEETEEPAEERPHQKKPVMEVLVGGTGLRREMVILYER
jgi:hypothetical protein